MKKVFLGIFVVLVMIITFLVIENGGFINKKISYITNLEEENQKALDQSEYVIFKNDSILQIEKESVTCFNLTSSNSRNVLWQETSYIRYPIIINNGNLVCVFDKQGYNGIVYNQSGKLYELKVNFPILEVSINKSGYTAVLQKSNDQSDTKSVITIFDNTGKKLIDRISYEENGGVPIAVAMSDNNDTFAASYLDVSNNNILSKVIFFKIDGKELKDNLFSSFEYQNTIVTNLKYIDEENVIVVGDNKLAKINLFTEKNTEIEIEDKIKEVILDFNDMIVLVCKKELSQLSSDTTYIEFYNTNLKKKKEQVIYNTVTQVASNKNTVVVGNGSDYYLYGKNGYSKCKNSFSVDVKQFLLFNKSNSLLVATNKGLELYRMQSASFMTE